MTEIVRSLESTGDCAIMAVALEETLDVDIFNPLRQDWLLQSV